MSEACGLCREVTATSAGRKKRKLLNGSACEAEKTLLKQYLIRYSGRRNYMRCHEMLNDHSTYLCSKCQKLLLKHHALEEQLTSLERQINVIIEALFSGVCALPAGDNSHTDSASTTVTGQVSQATSTARPFTNSPDVSVIIKRCTHSRTHSRQTAITPSRRKAIISITTGCYQAAANNVVAHSKTNKYVLTAVSRQIRNELKCICSLQHNSVLRGNIESIKHFSWDTVWEEFTQVVPTVVTFLQNLLPKADKIFIASLICLILQQRCKHMSLFQRVMSVLLYGHGTSKQVYRYLQAFKMCMSPSTTVGIIGKLSADYDAKVLQWSEEIKKITMPTQPSNNSAYGLLSDQLPSDDDSSSTTDYSVGDISLFSECESIASDSTDEHNNLEEITELPQTELNVDIIEEQDLMSVDEQETNEMNGEADSSRSLVTTESRQDTSQLDLQQSNSANSFGYVEVIDNIDFNVRRSFQRIDRSTCSYHFCHAYAVRNRINTSILSDGPPSGVLTCDDILPSKDDLKRVMDDITVLVSRSLVEHMPDFRGHHVFVSQHIPSDYDEEMSQKSVVVPLGVQLNNENKLKEMVQILLGLNKYVPVEHTEHTVEINGTHVTQPITELWPRMLFGDQLTVARVRGAAALRSWHKTTLDRLEGHVPATSDWHARLCLVTVIHNRFYSTSSPNDKGTLFHLKQVVNRTSYGKIPKNNMKATEDFLETVLHAHILTAAKQIIKTTDEVGDCSMVAKSLVEQFVKVSLPCDEALQHEMTCNDFVHAYAVDFLTTGLLWQGFHDAIRCGDGNRILTYWKFLIVIFKKEHHHNYAKEGFLLLAQSLVLSARKTAELKWCRTVNTHGRAGKNIPVDLHMEHLNRKLKDMMHNLGSNITPESVQRISKALGAVSDICSNFEETTKISSVSNFHSRPSLEKDLVQLQEQLEKEQVFEVKQCREHQGFRKYKPLLSSINWKVMKDWVKEKILDYDVYN